MFVQIMLVLEAGRDPRYSHRAAEHLLSVLILPHRSMRALHARVILRRILFLRWLHRVYLLRLLLLFAWRLLKVRRFCLFSPLLRLVLVLISLVELASLHLFESFEFHEVFIIRINHC